MVAGCLTLDAEPAGSLSPVAAGTRGYPPPAGSSRGGMGGCSSGDAQRLSLVPASVVLKRILRALMRGGLGRRARAGVRGVAPRAGTRGWRRLQRQYSMPNQLTIFAALYLVFVDGAAALAVVAFLLWRQPRLAALRWAVRAVMIVALAYALATVAGAVYFDKRPFVEDHVKPLISHARDNGFPSDHALLAAVLVSLVATVDLRFATPFVILMIAVDWARVGSGVHHPADVIASTVLVLGATLLANWMTTKLLPVFQRAAPKSKLQAPNL